MGGLPSPRTKELIDPGSNGGKKLLKFHIETIDFVGRGILPIFKIDP